MAGLGALAACAVCCAGPLLALLGGVGLASAVAAVWVPALAAVAVAAVLALVLLRRRRRSASCRSGDPGPVDLGMPAVADRPGR
ncbi:hypothetical protein [Streptomyces sp. A012304]|uniref:hypothetical protein n=1 Tax=Streptomyces sp. A012304 TaxID=375446 RepID=UPI00222F3066|nr:hypothetical protein [Streptomyces sp. A012304]